MLKYEFTRTTYLRRNKAGEIVAREAIDPTTIYVLLDEQGNIPAPPFAAYQQIIDGISRALMTTDMLEVEPPYPNQISQQRIYETRE